MSQEEILDLLEEKEMMTIREISEELNTRVYPVWISLKRMLKAREVIRIEISPEDCKKYNLSSKGRKHFLWKANDEKICS